MSKVSFAKIAEKLTCSTITIILVVAIICGILGVSTLIIIPLGISFLIAAGILAIIGFIGLISIIAIKGRNMSKWCIFNVVLSTIAIILIIVGIVRGSVGGF